MAPSDRDRDRLSLERAETAAASAASAAVEMREMREDIKEIKEILRSQYITRAEFAPIERAVYLAITTICLAVIAAIVGLVVTRPATAPNPASAIHGAP